MLHRSSGVSRWDLLKKSVGMRGVSKEILVLKAYELHPVGVTLWDLRSDGFEISH
jgi:hypothetical protein